MRRVFLSIAVVAGILAGGCATQKIPTFPWPGERGALETLAERTSAVKTVSSPCTFFVKRRDGYIVSLEGALAASVPGNLRIRAWKFGEAVLDVTVTPDGVWTLPERGMGAPDAPDPAGADAGRLAEAWSLLTGDFYRGPGVRVVDPGGNRFYVERREAGGPAVRCEVDRPTLTTRSVTVADQDGNTRLTLLLERYRLVGEIPWPHRLVAEIGAAPGERRPGPEQPERVTMRFDQPELNTELPTGAFTPPRRAVKHAESSATP